MNDMGTEPSKQMTPQISGVSKRDSEISARNISRGLQTGDLLTVEEVAKWLRVTPAWVRAHANGNRAPKLPSLKLGAHRRFRREAVEEFLRTLSNAA